MRSKEKKPLQRKFIPTLKGDFSNNSLPDDKNVENSDQTPMYIGHNSPSKKSQKQYQQRVAMIVFAKY